MTTRDSQYKRTAKSVPDLLRNEAAAALAALAGVCLISALFDAPVEGPVQPGGIAVEHVKAPWIFVGIQQMLRYLPALVAGVLLPALTLVTVAAIPWLRLGRRGAVLLFLGLGAMCLVMTVWGYFA